MIKTICEFIIAVAVVIIIIIFVLGFFFHLIEYIGNTGLDDKNEKKK